MYRAMSRFCLGLRAAVRCIETECLEWVKCDWCEKIKRVKRRRKGKKGKSEKKESMSRKYEHIRKTRNREYKERANKQFCLLTL